MSPRNTILITFITWLGTDREKNDPKSSSQNEMKMRPPIKHPNCRAFCNDAVVRPLINSECSGRSSFGIRKCRTVVPLGLPLLFLRHHQHFGAALEVFWGECLQDSIVFRLPQRYRGQFYEDAL